jgi:mono/diheme cytochrome c family protein
MILLALLLAQAVPDPAVTARGQKLFAQTCAVGYCHGSEGTANRGPALRGRNLGREYLTRVIRDGIPDTAMPGFKERLPEADLRAVIDYVVSLSAAGPPSPAPAPLAAGAPKSDAPTVSEADPGGALFFDANRELRCATCHEYQGRGIPVAQMKAGQVRRAKLANGESFPAVVASDKEGIMQLYDLTVPPPVRRTIRKDELASLDTEPEWKHSVVTRSYSESELTRIREFVKNPAFR